MDEFGLKSGRKESKKKMEDISYEIKRITQGAIDNSTYTIAVNVIHLLTQLGCTKQLIVKVCKFILLGAKENRF